MSSPFARLLLLVCAAVAVVPATAGAATKTSIPKVSSVSPKKLKIGDRLTIKGSGFLKGKNRNTVVFKATGQRAVFVQAESGTPTKLVVKVPAKLATFLKVSGGSSVATRFQLRVLARKLSKSYTSAAGSPVIAPAAAASGSTGTKTGSSSASSPAGSAASGPADCDADGATDAADTDDDNDLLNDGLEQHIGTTVCNADTDGDSMQDGWEYQSAIDRNAIACTDTVNGEYPVACPAAEPYPLKTTYANPLYFDNAGSDYDHDSIPTVEEYRAWKRNPAHSLSNMWYSDGLQASVDSVAGDGCRGMTVTNLAIPSPLGITASWTIPTAYEESHDLNGNGCLADDERDEDGDLLTNWDEISGRMSGASWWALAYDEEGTYPDARGGTKWLDANTDGDSLIDGLDDQDEDDLLNIEELERGVDASVDHSGLWVNPFNPCLPWRQSDSCDIHPPFDPQWAPFKTTGIPTTWPMYRTWGTRPVWNDDEPGWVEDVDNPNPPAHLIRMPSTP